MKSASVTYQEDGFTLVETVIGLTILGIMAISIFSLFTSMVSSTIVAKQKAIASTLATNQMEYLKSLPYDSLAVAGGSIYTTTPLPATSTQKINGVTYTTTTSINYVDDAYDGCANYPTLALKQFYCRNYPPPSGAPATDTNPEDYKIIHVKVTNSSGTKLAEVDTQVAAKVAETSSTTGALFVTVIDNSGNAVADATVNVVNNSLAPAINLSDTTDSRGTAIFYGLPPYSTAYNYVITASKNNYSSLTTIAPSGSLQPNYPSQKIFTQQSSYSTLQIKLQGVYSTVIEATDTSGNPLPNMKVYAKGGYKKYTATTDTSYYFDNFTPSDTRPTTDASGLAGLTNLVPGSYYFCGDTGSSNCKIGATTYYKVATIPYSGSNSLEPLRVPIYDPASPPSVVFPYGGTNYIQKTRLMFSTNSAFPRLFSLSPAGISLASDPLTNILFTINGTNLPCSSTAASCSTTVSIKQGSNTYTASCTGNASGLQLNCSVNVSGISTGNTQLVITSGGNTLTTPGDPLIGGFIVSP